MTFGIDPRQPDILAYQGAPLFTIPCVNVNRAPTVYDINYPLLCFWRYNNNVPDINGNRLGNVWYLSHFFLINSEQSAHWEKIIPNFTWTDQSADFNAHGNNGYFLTAALTAMLPSSPEEGESISFIGTTTSSVVIQAASGQVIQQGTSASSGGGTFTSVAAGNTLNLIYQAGTSTWWATGPSTGTWTAA